MEKLDIQSQSDTPLILFDKEKGVFKIEGQSLPENAPIFYKPLFDWFDEYAKNPNKETCINYNLSYLNTASCKVITELTYRIKGFQDKGNNIEVVWTFEEMDLDMKKLGSDISFITGIPFTFKEIEGDDDDDF